MSNPVAIEPEYRPAAERSWSRIWVDRFALPPDLMSQARRRLGRVGLMFVGLCFIFYPAVALSGVFPFDAVVAVVMAGTALVSLGLFLATRWSRLSDSFVLILGLVYEIVLCLSTGTMAEWDIYTRTGTGSDMTFIPVIIVVFPLVVPCRPSFTVVSSLLAAATAPLGLYVMHWLGPGNYPTDQLLITSTVPALASVVLAYMGSRTIHRMGEELIRARKLGSYTLDRLLGRGGMGEVWLARHQMLSRPAAIKLIKSDPEGASVDQIARFEREVQLTTRLSHPNTITIFDYGRTSDGTFYYVMELLDGAPLDTIVDVVGPLSPARVGHVLKQISGSLKEAHGIGLIHRDIKPPNIVLCTQGGEPDVAKLLDFGLVKDIQTEDSVELTGEGRISGTPLYMSPEAIVTPDRVDARSDIYALGAVAYYLLTGEHVFNSKSLLQLCSHHLQTIPTPPSERLGRELPAKLEQLVLDCLEKEPADRPQSAAEMITRVDQCSLEDWTTAAAVEWWDEYGEALTPEQSAPISAKTVDVDFGSFQEAP